MSIPTLPTPAPTLPTPVFPSGLFLKNVFKKKSNRFKLPVQFFMMQYMVENAEEDTTSKAKAKIIRNTPLVVLFLRFFKEYNNHDNVTLDKGYIAKLFKNENGLTLGTPECNFLQEIVNLIENLPALTLAEENMLTLVSATVTRKRKHEADMLELKEEIKKLKIQQVATDTNFVTLDKKVVNLDGKMVNLTQCLNDSNLALKELYLQAKSQRVIGSTVGS